MFKLFKLKMKMISMNQSESRKGESSDWGSSRVIVNRFE